MDDQSPPKRITRARVAAKTDTGVKIATAASKARVTRNGSITKRKTKTDGAHEEDGDEISNPKIENELPKTTRGRGKKAAIAHEDDHQDVHNSEATDLPKVSRGRAKRATAFPDTKEEITPREEIIKPEEARTRRGRAKKAAVTKLEPELEMQEEDPAPVKNTRGRAKKETIEPAAMEPARSMRGRSKRAEIPEEEAAIAVEPPLKKPAGTRAATIEKVTAPKKTVKFEEPDKENIVPTTANAKRSATATQFGTGLRAKPVRKPVSAATRAVRGRAKVEEIEQKSSPLSPKKPTQVAMLKELVSDDELAVNEKTPMKPLMKSPLRAPGSVLGTAKKLDFSTSINVHRAVVQEFSGSIMASPARRPPQSPYKESLKTSPHRSNFKDSLMKSPMKLSLPPFKAAESATSSAFKSSLLQSLARRPQSPTKASEHGSPTRSQGPYTTISCATPKTSTFKISRFATPRTITRSAIRHGQMLPPSAFMDAAIDELKAKEDIIDSNELPTSSLAFSGRLSSIMPRTGNSSLSDSEPIVTERENYSTIELEPIGEAMVLNQEEIAEGIIVRSATQSCSPPRNSTATISLREVDENPFMNSDSDSEDELGIVSQEYSPNPMNRFASSPATPTPFTALNKTPMTQKTSLKDRSLRRSQIGYDPLASKFSDWMASSPEKAEDGSETKATSPTTPRAAKSANAIEMTPGRSTFFEDEMSIRDEMQPASESCTGDVIDERDFSPIDIVEEDLALAQEADEMSLLEPDVVEAAEEVEINMEVLISTDEPSLDREGDEMFLLESTKIEAIEQVENPTEKLISKDLFTLESIQADAEAAQIHVEKTQGLFIPGQHETVEYKEAPLSVENPASQRADDNAVKEADQRDQKLLESDVALSEASQEYGDENAFVIDPALLAMSAPRTPATPKFKTPKRVLAERVCHTVSKVPLKPAAEASPLRPSFIKRSASISRLHAPRPTSNLSRNNTVISYSPTKSSCRDFSPSRQGEEELIATPSKPDVDWSTNGTPARTPRQNLNTALLKGAVIFVDVHTSEGADASSLFIELLTQMGARCVKSWHWNPSVDDGSKIGITHIVFKDGGKRTLEKAKETGGVVACVGVGWVLDCERENKWLSESPYSVDTAMIPRGGHRRRKSMEPKALATLHGTLFPSTSTNPVRKSMSPMKNPSSFTDTPLTSKSRRRDSAQWVRTPSKSPGNDGTIDDEDFVLSPIPATPAPEVISAYGEGGFYGDETPDAQTPYFLKKEQLVQKTAPTSKFGNFELGIDMGTGFLTHKKDESVMMRLMAARRKSLQWAPKVGSPLARE